jgi:sulfur relay (sulfurtransferase) DsrC/TusE family protein
MGKNKNSSSLSEEEKELIQDMRKELEMMGVPRDQWAEYIQREINFRRSQERKKEKSEKKTGLVGFLRRFWDKIKEKIMNFFFKLTAKRFTDDEQALEQLQQMLDGSYEPSEQERQFMDMMNPQVEFDDVDTLGQGGASISNKDENKKMIVDFGDDE